MIGLFWSRFRAGRCHLVEKLMRTAARGDNIYTNLGNMHGRTIVDMMQILKDDKKPPDNSLDYASKKFLRKDRKAAEKIDLDKHAMFDMFRKGDPHDQWIIGEYCVRDSLICIWLMEDCKYLSQWIEMARASGTSMEDICNSGQQRKVFNSILLMLLNRLPLKSVLNESNANRLELEDMPEYGFVINDADSGWPVDDHEDDSSSDDEGPLLLKRSGTATLAAAAAPKKSKSARKRTADYQGATVLEPEAGFYERPVGSLDFNSLYPSIIRDQNLCFSTIVLEESAKARIRADKVPHEEYEIVHVKPDGSTFTKSYMFVKHIGGVLPKVLAFQLQLRKQIRKLEKSETDSFMKSVYNGQQLAVKVLMNSLYGFTGASSGILGCKPIAAVVTLRGRAMIELAKSTVEALVPGSRVLYGDTDSIMVLWPEIEEDGHLRSCTLKEAWDFGDRAAEEITSKFSMVVKIELEAVKWPFLLLGKKKYAAIQYESADGHGETIIRGLEPVRRDFTGLVKKTYKKCLDALLLERSVDQARQSLIESVVGVLSDSLPIEDFIITKQLNAEYADASVVPQYRAWQRMQERGDLNAPVVGMRMPYIVTGVGSTARPQFERTEHPDYVIRAKLPLDKEYYLTSLLRPIGDLLESTDIGVKQIIERAVKLTIEMSGISTHGAMWAKAGFKISKSKDSLMEKFKDLASKSRKRDRATATKTVSLLDFLSRKP
jgi:DNA polymerase elongation subunit (family B)